MARSLTDALAASAKRLLMAGALVAMPAFSWAATAAPRGDARSAEAPRRIASATVTGDEILMALLPPGHGRERVAALSLLADDARYSNVAAEAKAMPGRVGNDLEALARLKPDLIILSPFNRPEFTTHVDRLGIRRFAQKDIGSLADARANVIALGEAVGRGDAARDLAAGMDATLARLAPPTPRPRVLVFDPEGYAYGVGTTMHDIIARAGGRDVTDELGVKGWAKVSLEALLKAKPDVIVVAGPEDGAEAWLAAKRKETLWRGMGAIQDGKVIMLPPALLFSTSQHAAKAAEAVNAGLRRWAKAAPPPSPPTGKAP